MRHFFAFSLFGLALFLGLSLLTYNANDPSVLYNTTERIQVKNYGGKFGAELAGFMLFLFGRTVWLLVSIVVYSGYLLASNALVYTILRLLSLLFCFVYISAIGCSYIAVDGGAFGLLGYSVLQYFWEPWIILLFLYVSTLALLITLIQFSWIHYFSIYFYLRYTTLEKSKIVLFLYQRLFALARLSKRSR